MARVSNKARLLAATADFSPVQAGALADFLEHLALNAANDDIAEIETSTRASRRRAKAEVAEEAPARGRRKAKVEPEAAPAKRTRRAKAEVADDEDEAPVRRARAPKAEPLAEDVTVDDLYDILDSFEGEPVEGTFRDLKPQAEAYGFNVVELIDGIEAETGEKLSPKEKAEELGMALAAIIALEKQIVATLKLDPEAMDEIIDELDLELSERARGSAKAKAIVSALNDVAEDEDEDAEDEGDEDEDEDEMEEVAPRRRRAKAEVAEAPAKRTRRTRAEPEAAPAKSSRRKAAAKDDLSDLDDLD